MLDPQPGRRAWLASGDADQVDVSADPRQRLFDDLLKPQRGHACSPSELAREPEMRLAASATISSARCAYLAFVSGST